MAIIRGDNPQAMLSTLTTTYYSLFTLHVPGWRSALAPAALLLPAYSGALLFMDL